MAQIVIPPINLPSVPKDWMSTLLGIIASVSVLVKAYIEANGHISLEVYAIAVLIAVICYFIPAKLTPAEQAALAATVATNLNAVAGAKIPAVLTEERAVSEIEKTALDVGAQLGQDTAAPTTVQIGA